MTKIVNFLTSKKTKQNFNEIPKLILLFSKFERSTHEANYVMIMVSLSVALSAFFGDLNFKWVLNDLRVDLSRKQNWTSFFHETLNSSSREVREGQLALILCWPAETCQHKCPTLDAPPCLERRPGSSLSVSLRPVGILSRPLSAKRAITFRSGIRSIRGSLRCNCTKTCTK